MGLRIYPTSAQDNGVIVAAGAHAGPLVPVAARDLASDLRKIRAQVRLQHQKKQEERRKEDEQLNVWQQNFLATAPALFDNLPAQRQCGAAAAGGGYLDGYVRWVPPCSSFAKAAGLRAGKEDVIYYSRFWIMAVLFLTGDTSKGYVRGW